MATRVNGLQLRRVLDRGDWGVPEQFGPDGWRLRHKHEDGSVIVSTANHEGAEWTHASMAYRDRVPTYDELVRLKRAVWGSGGWAMQVFPPEREHVNIHPYALHLWGPANGQRPEGIPDFGVWGTI